MSEQVDLGTLLKRVDSLEGEIERLKRDLLRSLVAQPRRRLDTSRAKKEFGFEAKISFAEGLANTIAWYERNCESLVNS